MGRRRECAVSLVSCNSLAQYEQTAHIRSRHGVVISCTLQGLNSELGKALEGKRYGFIKDEELGVDVSGKTAVVWAWLKEEMSSYN